MNLQRSLVATACVLSVSLGTIQAEDLLDQLSAPPQNLIALVDAEAQPASTGSDAMQAGWRLSDTVAPGLVDQATQDCSETCLTHLAPRCVHWGRTSKAIARSIALSNL